MHDNTFMLQCFVSLFRQMCHKAFISSHCHVMRLVAGNVMIPFSFVKPNQVPTINPQVI